MGEQQELTRKTIKYIALYVVGLLVGGGFIILSPNLLGFLVFAIIFLGGLFALVYWHAHTFKFRCQCCGNVFEISTLKDLISPHGLQKENGWKFLCCPKCKKWSKTQIISENNYDFMGQ